MRERFSGLTPTTGLNNATISDYRFLDATTTLVQVIETLDISSIDTGLLELNHRIASPARGTDQSGNTMFRLETGSTSGAGTAFTLLSGDGVFGGVGVREVKVYDETGFLAVNYDAITALGITTVTATYYTDGTAFTARLLGEICQTIGSGAVASDAGYYVGTAGENLILGTVYQAADGMIYQFDDPTSILQCYGLGYIIEAVSIGNDIDVYFRGNVAKPAAASTLPIGKPIVAAATGTVTWDGGTALPDQSFQALVGRSFDGSTIELNIVALLGPRV